MLTRTPTPDISGFGGMVSSFAKRYLLIVTHVVSLVTTVGSLSFRRTLSCEKTSEENVLVRICATQSGFFHLDKNGAYRDDQTLKVLHSAEL
jgi:hypothetical protein